MSEKIEHEGPKPLTRREALENEQHEEGLWGPEIHATAHEPLPEVEPTGYPEVTLKASRVELHNRGFTIATVTMVLLSFITFFIPLFNGLLGGAMGGFFARTWQNALKAAVVASVLVPALFFVLYGWDSPNSLYLFYGLGFWGWTALHIVGLLIGALAGIFASYPVSRRRAGGEATHH
jgi:hypothetical protein